MAIILPLELMDVGSQLLERQPLDSTLLSTLFNIALAEKSGCCQGHVPSIDHLHPIAEQWV
jgi:hypothetical protein